MKTSVFSIAVGSAFLAGCVSHQSPAPLSPQDQVRIAGASEVYEEFVRDVRREQFAEAAALFSADARMTNHALVSAKGPAEIQAMLQKLNHRESFIGGPSGAIKGDAVVLSGPCYRSRYQAHVFPGQPYPVGPSSNGEFWATLKEGPDGGWRFTYFETFEVAQSDVQDAGAPQQDLGSTSTP